MAMVRKTVRLPQTQLTQLEAEATARGIPVGTWMAVKLEDSVYQDRQRLRMERAKRRLATIRSRQ